MIDILQKVLSVTLVIFMAGNLLEMGLKIKVGETLGALGNWRFVGSTILWAFLLCPAVAVLLTKVLPLAEPYAVGLLFLGMAPGAPFLPAVAAKAGGDLAYVGAFMLLSAAGTIIFMPLAVPVLIAGFSADPWTIARPLVLFIATPLAVGIAVQIAASSFARKAHPIVKWITGVDTLIMLGIVLWIYAGDFVSAFGTFAIGAQILFTALVTAGSYFLGAGLAQEQKSVLSLGVCTRNIGAAIAPLFAAAGTDRRAIAMCVLGLPVQVIFAYGAARLMAGTSSKDGGSEARVV
jgi:BASS family bile acid:Na+ symporter